MVLTMVAERGDASEVTLREVARRIGVSHNAPYRHFEDKDTLLAAVATEGFQLLSRELRTARASVDDPEARFVRTGLSYLAFAQEHRGYLAVMHGPGVAKGHNSTLQSAANDTFQILKDAALDAGEVDVTIARRLGTVAWSFLYGTAMLSINRQIPPSVGATPQDLVELGLRHLFQSFRRAARPASRGHGRGGSAP